MNSIKKMIILIIFIGSAMGGVFIVNKFVIPKFDKKDTEVISKKTEENEVEQPIYVEQSNVRSIKISAVGDCTIGWDTNLYEPPRFDTKVKEVGEDYSYFFKKVKPIFDEDDLTIINLEGTFTNNKVKVPKMFNFSAPPEYKEIINSASIEMVSFANNHTHDYGEIGYKDTLDTLDSINMPHYGYDDYLVKEINGIKIGFFALSDISCNNYKNIDKALKYLKEQECELIIASMHWGAEHTYKQHSGQTNMAHYMIDNGVDLILGAHPHRLQGIEKYKDRFIVYSLANFCFGGNYNPEDKDTMIFQQTFTFEDNELKLDDNINIIPASVSGEKNVNNYQPIVLEGTEKERVMNKIMKYSVGFNYQEKD